MAEGVERGDSGAHQGRGFDGVERFCVNQATSCALPAPAESV
jgi:hypothetical protein